MKSAILLLAGAGLAAAQSLTDLPPCGQVCVGNMISIAGSQLGCSPGDLKCYCTNVNFGYGIRDCSNQSCPPGDAAKVIEYGTKYCAAVLAGSAVSSLPGSTAAAVTGTGSGSAPASASGSASGSGAGASPTGTGAASSAITTIPLIAASTGSDTTFITTTGFSTIYGPNPGAASSAIGSISSNVASATSSLASAASSALGSASSAIGSVSSGLASASDAANSATSALGSALSSATQLPSSTHTGGAPVQTAAPILVGAGLLAMLAL